MFVFDYIPKFCCVARSDNQWSSFWDFPFFFFFTGTDVVIVKSGRRICGTGGCLANAPLHQNKSYFEFKIQSTGKMSSVKQIVDARTFNFVLYARE